MDRQCAIGVLLVVAAAIGCSKSDGKRQNAATATAPSTAAMPSSAAPTAEKTAASAEETTVTVTMNGRAAVKTPTIEMNIESGQPADSIERSLAAPAESFSEAVRGQASPPAADGNPLRLDFEPRPESRIRTNPLRTMNEPELPAAAMPSSPTPAAAPPSGGAAPEAAPPAVSQTPASDAIGGAARAQGASSEAGAEMADLFDEVEVFYGTDRQSAAREPVDGMQIALHFLPTGVSLFLTLALGVVAVGRRSWRVALLALMGVGASAGLGFQGSAAALSAIRHGGSEGPRYTTERAAGGLVELGLCQVTIPCVHQVGEVESPSITHLEIHPDLARHVVLRKTERLLDDRFYELLRERTLASPRREVFVFIHGFNVSFEDAARRTAQIHYDLKFAGAPIFFSWPAHNKFILTYPADEKNVAWSVPHLKQFLLSIVQESQAQSINLIAHSMGNRALTAALREIEQETRGDARLFNQVILAAPDIDAEEFRQSIAPAMLKTAKQMTLYASARDDALLASQLVHRGPRAGDAGSGLVVVPGIDTIDVTAIDSSPWGHSYYGSSDPVLNDLRALFTGTAPAKERNWLAPAQRGELTYWIFQAARTATAVGELNR